MSTATDRRTIKLPLHPAPNDKWHADYGWLLCDSWLAQKYDRRRRIRDHVQYLNRYCPEFWGMDPGAVLDVGCGPGELLEIARAAGCYAMGVEATSGDGGMGKDYWELSRLMHVRQRLDVRYTHLADEARSVQQVVADFSGQRFSFVNMRGSIEQILHSYLDGPPHHEHHDCKQLNWRFGIALNQALCKLMGVISNILAENGIVLIHCNGTGTDENTARFDHWLEDVASECNLVSLARSPRLHKWRLKHGQ